MSQKPNYFKIGLFVLISVGIFIAALMLLGAGELFQEHYYLETYFDESVQGVEVGTPVKHRGVPLGSIDKIDFVKNIYGSDIDFEDGFTVGRYVYVRVALNTSAFGSLGAAQSKRLLEKTVEEGLRMQMNPQGITGVYYLEVEYFDPERNPPLEITWEPEYPYIPSAPSLFTKLGDSVDEVFTRLQALDIEGIVSDVHGFLQVATSAIQDASVSNISVQLTHLLAELRQTNARVKELLSNPQLDLMAGNVVDTVASARRIVEKSEDEVALILSHLEGTSYKINQFLGDREGANGSLEDVSHTLKNIRIASEGFPDTLSKLNRTIKDIDQLISERRADVEEVLDNLRSISADLAEITSNAKKYPSQLLLGEPPPRSE